MASRAVNLAELVSAENLTVSTSTNRIGVGSTAPTAKFDVAGIVSATSFFGDATGLTNLPAGGATLSAASGSQRVVVTSLTSGTMTAAGTNADLAYNTSTNTLSATTFSGALTGNASGTAGGLSGNPSISITNLTGVAATFTGNVTIGGTLTYDDVTNVDSIGIVTAQTGVRVLAGGVGIADSIFHIGDDNTQIRFPAADTVSVETGGGERLRIDSSGNVAIGTATAGGTFHVEKSGELNVVLEGRASTLGTRLTLKNNDDTANAYSEIEGADAGGQGTAAIRFINNSNANNEGSLQIYTRPSGGSSTERLRIDSVGRLLVDTTADRPIEQPFGNGLNSAQPGKIVVEDSGAGHLNLIVARENQSNAYGPAISLVKSRGTSDGSYTIVQSGDNLGTIQFGGADGSADRVGAAVVAQVDTTPGSDDMPARLVFATTPDGSGHPTERLRIASAGQIGLGGANYGTSGQALVSNGSGSAPTWQDVSAGISSSQSAPSANTVVTLNLGTAQHHELNLAAGITTITCTGGNPGDSHSIVLTQPSSGITTVGFSTYFLFPSGSTPSMSEGNSKVDLVSFVIKRVGTVVGVAATELLASAGLNYSN